MVGPLRSDVHDGGSLYVDMGCVENMMMAMLVSSNIGPAAELMHAEKNSSEAVVNSQQHAHNGDGGFFTPSFSPFHQYVSMIL
jgi:hypothetical protein